MPCVSPGPRLRKGGKIFKKTAEFKVRFSRACYPEKENTQRTHEKTNTGKEIAMKRTYLSLAAMLAAACLLSGCGQSADSASGKTDGSAAEAVTAVERITDIATTQYFTDEAVAQQDLETIVLAGVNAPSAMNGQPWHFSVITDGAVLEQISTDMSAGMSFGGKAPEGADLPEGVRPPEGSAPPAAPPAGGPGGAVKAGVGDAPAAIVISCKDGSELDAGLACQNMSAAAQLMGYGTKILSSPTMALNGEKKEDYKSLLGIPEDQSAVAVLLIGKEDASVDESVDGYTGATARNPLDGLVTYVTG